MYNKSYRMNIDFTVTIFRRATLLLNHSNMLKKLTKEDEPRCLSYRVMIFNVYSLPYREKDLKSHSEGFIMTKGKIL